MSPISEICGDWGNEYCSSETVSKRIECYVEFTCKCLEDDYYGDFYCGLDDSGDWAALVADVDELACSYYESYVPDVVDCN